ncbi:MAG: 50S ribosomal protein L25/general stress protein Ctc [Magnetococcales bacterium]|nr:50S ribosomal protein L25/general stress protein Ctc [Magnetococcales bacterium]MBF0321966.1 50S ribosomal protein L25/general stress protein Ctc [Magnetococcales bacterium]
MAQIKAFARSGTGKGVARKLRREGLVPAVVYGAGQENLNISLERKEWNMLMEAEGRALRTHPQHLVLDDGKRVTVLVRSSQRHPVTSVTEHVDFLRFDPMRRIDIMVPVVVKGETESPGVKRGGMVQAIRRELHVQCRADHIPEWIEISVAGLEIGESVHIQDIKLPDGVEVHAEDNFTVAAVVGVQAEEVDTAAPEATTTTETTSGGEGDKKE